MQTRLLQTRSILFFFCLLLLSAAPARAQRDYSASGFMLQTLLGGAANLYSLNGPSTANFSMVSGIRIGGMLRKVAIAANVQYSSLARLDSRYDGLNQVTLGPDVMPTIWQNPTGQARMYVLIGVNTGAVFDTETGSTRAHMTGGFTLGLGGNYFLHPNFALGVEVGWRTQLTNINTNIYVASALYAALSGTFVAGQ